MTSYLSNTTEAKGGSANRTSPAQTSLMARRPLPFPGESNTSTNSMSAVFTDADELLYGSWDSPALTKIAEASAVPCGGSQGGSRRRCTTADGMHLNQTQSFEKRAESIACNSYSWRRFSTPIGIKHLHASHINVFFTSP